MARVTVEDCLDKVTNRFELVAVASQRAKNIANGAPLTIERNKEKDAVLSLREIAAGTVAVEALREQLAQSMQRYRDAEEPVAAPLEENTESSEENTRDIAAEMAEVAKSDGFSMVGEEGADAEDEPGIVQGNDSGDYSFAQDNLKVDD